MTGAWGSRTNGAVLRPIAIALLLATAPAPAGAADLASLARRAFSCQPLHGVPGGARVEPKRPKTKRHRIPSLGLSLRLPKAWKAPLAPSSFAAEAASADGRTTVRVVVERLDGLRLRAAVALHEGRSFGPSAISEGCAAALLHRYGRDPESAVLGMYRSRLPYKGQTTTWVLYEVRDGALVSLAVEARWTDRHRPDHGAVDAILAGLRWL